MQSLYAEIIVHACILYTASCMFVSPLPLHVYRLVVKQDLFVRLLQQPCKPSKQQCAEFNAGSSLVKSLPEPGRVPEATSDSLKQINQSYCVWGHDAFSNCQAMASYLLPSQSEVQISGKCSCMGSSIESELD